MSRYNDKASQIINSASCTQDKKAEIKDLNAENKAIKTACNVGMGLSLCMVSQTELAWVAFAGIGIMKDILTV